MTAFLEKHANRIVQVSESGCMIWVGASLSTGYGSVWSGTRTAAGNKLPVGAHRASYCSAFGEIPQGAHVLHRCDVRPCVNPDHLFLGDQAANSRDMATKGRSCIGARHGMALMTEDVVRRIRSEYQFRRVTAADLAEKYGFTRSAVAAAIRRQTWKHI